MSLAWGKTIPDNLGNNFAAVIAKIIYMDLILSPTNEASCAWVACFLPFKICEIFKKSFTSFDLVLMRPCCKYVINTKGPVS